MTPLRLRLTAGLPPTYWFLWLGTLINRLGGFVVPFLTLYLTGQRGISVSQAALMVSLFGAGSFTAALVGGELADRLGRRPVLLLSFLIAPANMILLGLARPVALIALLTLLQGFFTDLYRPAVSAAVADLVPPEGRPRAYGYIYWAINLGAAIAPAIAGLLARADYLLLFVGDALTTFLFGLIVLWGVRETRPGEVQHTAAVALRTRAAMLGREPLLLVFAGLALVFGTIYMQGNVTLPVDMQAHGLGPDQYGLAIAVNGALIVLLSIPASHAAARWPRFGTLAVAALLLGVGFGLTAVSNTLLLYCLAVAVWTLGEIGGATVAPAIVADLSPVELRGLYQGIFSAAWGLAAFTGPLIGGWVYDHLGAQALWVGCLLLGCLLALGYLALARPAGRRLARTTIAADR
ncbi:MAG TPA: MFS transporter [Anaerolineae bacterium]|nr:MFS transporter [Anaerolineae bacterium]